MALLPKVKLKALPTFPSNIIGGVGLESTKANGHVTIDYAWQEFGAISSIPTSPTSYILTYDTATNAYVMVPSHLLGGAVAGISDAPNDGTQYGRQSGGWTPVAGGGGGVPATIPPLQDGIAAIGVSAKYAREDHVHPTDPAIALKAPLASPTFTGDPKAPTASPGDNDTSIATTAFVTAALSTVSGALPTGGQTGYMLQGPATSPTWNGFLQSGTGAVTRTWQNKDRERVSVFDFVDQATFVQGSITVTGTGTDCAGALAAAHQSTTPNGNVRIVFPPGNYRAGPAIGLNFAGNCVLEFMPGAVLCPDAGITVTIRNPVIADPGNRIFGNNGAVVGIGDVHPEWWGAIADGAVDCINAMDKAFACVKASTVRAQPTIRFSKGTYLVSRSWIVSPTNSCGLNILGAGSYDDGTRIRSNAAMNVVQVMGSPDGTNQVSFVMRDIWVEAGIAAGSCALKFNNAGDVNILSGQRESLIEGCKFSGAQYGVLAYRLIQMMFRRCGFHTEGMGSLASRGVTLMGEPLAGGFFGCDTVRFEKCHWYGDPGNNNSYGVEMFSQSNISAIQFEVCEWINNKRCVNMTTAINGKMGDIWFDRCQFDGAGIGAIEIVQNGTIPGGMSDIHILDCYGTAVGQFFVSASAGVLPQGINGLFIHGCWTAGISGSAVKLFNCSTVSVQDNIFSGVTNPGGAVIFGQDLWNSIIAGNSAAYSGQLPDTTTFANMVVVQGNCKGNQIHDNNASGYNTGAVVVDTTSTGPNYKYSNGPIATNMLALPDGQMMRWGTAAGGSLVTVSFGAPGFKTAPFVTATVIDAPDGVTSVNVMVSSVTATDFKASTRYSISGSIGVAGESFNWMAIGQAN
jgi:hypothetical protein